MEGGQERAGGREADKQQQQQQQQDLEAAAARGKGKHKTRRGSRQEAAAAAAAAAGPADIDDEHGAVLADQVLQDGPLGRTDRGERLASAAASAAE